MTRLDQHRQETDNRPAQWEWFDAAVNAASHLDGMRLNALSLVVENLKATHIPAEDEG